MGSGGLAVGSRVAPCAADTVAGTGPFVETVPCVLVVTIATEARTSRPRSKERRTRWGASGWMSTPERGWFGKVLATIGWGVSNVTGRALSTSGSEGLDPSSSFS